MADVLHVDPRLALPYYTYVIRGFLDAQLVNRVRFKRLDAPLPDGGANGAAMSLRYGGRLVRLFVSTGDHPDISTDILDWADAYGKVNLAHDEADSPKLVAIGPVFGITLWPLPRGYSTALKMSIAGAPLRARLSDVRFQAIARVPLECYVPRASKAEYVFHASRRWTGKHHGTNAPRERFLAACLRLGISVDGGLTDTRMSLASYIVRLQQSAFAFNCPAVHRCHGWKLGEYLALGKAIISTTLSRQVPAPLVHGEHVHFVEDTEDAIAEAVLHVMGDPQYREHLEIGARRWYEDHLQPAVVAERVLRTAAP